MERHVAPPDPPERRAAGKVRLLLQQRAFPARVAGAAAPAGPTRPRHRAAAGGKAGWPRRFELPDDAQW